MKKVKSERQVEIKDNFKLAMTLVYGAIDGYNIGALTGKSVWVAIKVAGTVIFVKDNSKIKEKVNEILKGVHDFKKLQAIAKLEQIVASVPKEVN